MTAIPKLDYIDAKNSKVSNEACVYLLTSFGIFLIIFGKTFKVGMKYTYYVIYCHHLVELV